MPHFVKSSPTPILAVLIARKSGMPYAEFLNQRVFAPLGMVDAVSCPGQLKSHHDHFYPHIQLNGVTSALPAPQCTGFEGSSCVYLSATDVAQWLRFQLEGTGALDGKTILSPDALKMTRTPQSIDHNPPPPTGENFALYCMGWQAFDFHGKKVFRHTGSEVGASTQIMFCPEERLGVAAFINIYGNGFLAMSYHIMESLMGKHVRDWITPTEAAFAKRINGELQALEDKFPLSVPPAATQMLVAYTGLYRSPLHCDAVVSVNDGTLRYEMRDCPLLNVSLTPAGEHVFTVHHDYPGMEQDLLGQRKRVRFTVDNGRAVGLSHSLLGDFTRSGF
jgi:CubicO group peptidase (beta-lactamase class C family)